MLPHVADNIPVENGTPVKPSVNLQHVHDPVMVRNTRNLCCRTRQETLAPIISNHD